MRRATKRVTMNVGASGGTTKDVEMRQAVSTVRSFCLAGGLIMALSTGHDVVAQGQPTEIDRRPDYQVLLDVDGNLINLVIPAGLYAQFEAQSFDRESVEFVTTVLYQSFADSFDFVCVTPDPRMEWKGSRIVGRNFHVSVPAEGLGLNFRSMIAEAGSAGRLASILFLQSPENLVGGPSLHEIMHTWGQYILPTDYRAHWGRSDVNGSLGGWEPGTLTRSSEGFFGTSQSRRGGPLMSFRSGGGNTWRYADLELYLMGLLPADSVGPVEVAIDAESVPGQGSTFAASGFDTYTIERIVEENGPREPAYGQAPSSFRAALVIVSIIPLGKGDWARWSRDVEKFSLPGDDGDDRLYNFWEATGGRGVLEMGSLEEVLLQSAQRPEARRE